MNNEPQSFYSLNERMKAVSKQAATNIHCTNYKLYCSLLHCSMFNVHCVSEGRAYLVGVMRFEHATPWSQTNFTIFFQRYVAFLTLFAPENLLFDALISTVSVYSEAVYGQRCGQERYNYFMNQILQLSKRFLCNAFHNNTHLLC